METTTIKGLANIDKMEWGSSLHNNSYAVSNSISLTGIDSNGTEKTLVPNVISRDYILSDSTVSQYKKFNLKWDNKDSLNKIPPMLTYLRLESALSTELVFRQDIYSLGFNDSIMQNDAYIFSTAIQNISITDSDSILIKYWLAGKNNEPIYLKVKPLMRGDSMFLPEMQFSTNGLSGNQMIILEINADYNQPENCIANNTLIIPFYVNSLNTNSTVLNKQEITAYNYPNPASSYTNFVIKSDINNTYKEIAISIYDINGKLIKQLKSNENSVFWDCKDDSGKLIPAGNYFYNIHGTDAENNTNKIITGKLQVVR